MNTPQLLPGLKTERLDRHPYATHEEARADVFDYMERIYSPKRRFSVLDYLSPVQVEEQAAFM